jgi:uncharacterized protein (UPF0332 family)
MFYCAEALLFSRGFSYSSHRGVIAGFGQHFAKTGDLPLEMHRWLLEGFDRRQEGDYPSLSIVQEHQVRDLQTKATRFLQMSEAYVERSAGKD